MGTGGGKRASCIRQRQGLSSARHEMALPTVSKFAEALATAWRLDVPDAFDDFLASLPDPSAALHASKLVRLVSAVPGAQTKRRQWLRSAHFRTWAADNRLGPCGRKEGCDAKFASVAEGSDVLFRGTPLICLPGILTTGVLRLDAGYSDNRRISSAVQVKKCYLRWDLKPVDSTYIAASPNTVPLEGARSYVISRLYRDCPPFFPTSCQSSLLWHRPYMIPGARNKV